MSRTCRQLACFYTGMAARRHVVALRRKVWEYCEDRSLGKCGMKFCSSDVSRMYLQFELSTGAGYLYQISLGCASTT